MKDKVNLNQKTELITETWVPKIVGELNGQYIKLVKGRGEFTWHQHENEDEFFLVVKGQLTIHLRDRDVALNEGEFFIVPRGVEHKPEAREDAYMMLYEPVATLNTGDVRNELTQEKLDWI
jgi:mannose-6-phosphate isomerase-like protein (cupin superfamily)